MNGSIRASQIQTFVDKIYIDLIDPGTYFIIEWHIKCYAYYYYIGVYFTGRRIRTVFVMESERDLHMKTDFEPVTIITMEYWH